MTRLHRRLGGTPPEEPAESTQVRRRIQDEFVRLGDSTTFDNLSDDNMTIDDGQLNENVLACDCCQGDNARGRSTTRRPPLDATLDDFFEGMPDDGFHTTGDSNWLDCPTTSPSSLENDRADSPTPSTMIMDGPTKNVHHWLNVPATIALARPLQIQCYRWEEEGEDFVYLNYSTPCGQQPPKYIKEFDGLRVDVVRICRQHSFLGRGKKELYCVDMKISHESSKILTIHLNGEAPGYFHFLEYEAPGISLKVRIEEIEQSIVHAVQVSSTKRRRLILGC